MILTEKISINIRSKNIKYYNNLGYNVRYNDVIEISTEHLPIFI